MVTPNSFMQTWGEDFRRSVETPRAPTQVWEEEYYSTEEEEYNQYGRWEYVHGPYGWHGNGH
eukprot:7856994-Prorocentrum_lima.AAC.1